MSERWPGEPTKLDELDEEMVHDEQVHDRESGRS